MEHEWYYDGDFVVCRKCGAFTLDKSVDVDVDVIQDTKGNIRPAHTFETGVSCSEMVMRKVMEL